MTPYISFRPSTLSPSLEGRRNLLELIGSETIIELSQIYSLDNAIV